MSYCWECGELFELSKEEEEKGKRVRGRRCKKCKNATVVARRHKDPTALIQHRMYNSFHRVWPNADKKLCSIKTVRAVWERCEKKSVISGETDPDLLCISYKHKPADKDEPPSIEDLVVITTKEAQSFAHLTLWERAGKFEEKKE